LSGIVHLVASSVPNLDAEQVSVVDQQGKLLSSQGADSEFAYTQEQFRHRRELEADYSQRILGILEPILGAGAVRAQVAADMDFTRTESTTETFAPESTVRSEQTSEEVSNQRFAGGVPGTLSNEPPFDAALTALQPGVDPAADPADANADGETDQRVIPPARTSRRSTVNYEIDKTISHIMESPGTLQKLSIAVVLDHIEVTADDGSVTREPLPQERIDEITALVREAVGFNAERGDTVSVISASFVEVAPVEDVVIESSILEQDWVWQLGKGLLALIVLLALVFIVLRPMARFAAAPAPVMTAPQNLPPQPMVAGAIGAQAPMMTDDQVTLGGGQMGLPGTMGGAGAAQGYQQQLQMARSVAAGEPERAAYVVKNWVAGDG
jgi:flagellar M-ring protein FliF